MPLLIIADLLGSHWYDVPTVDPRYWTEPPESVVRLKADPGLIRIFGKADKSAAEPGYVSEPIDFLEGREQLDWSLGLAWNIPGSKGETPIIPLRYLDYMDHARVGGGRFDIESVTHVLTGRRWKERILPAKCDVRLIPWLTDKNEMTGGKNLIVVGALGHVLHFRMFDGNGKMVVDTDEKRLTERTRQIEDLRKQLAGLWPPHELSESEKSVLSSRCLGNRPSDDPRAWRSSWKGLYPSQQAGHCRECGWRAGRSMSETRPRRLPRSIA